MSGRTDSETTDCLEREFSFFLANQEPLVAKYRGRVVVIRDQQVVSVHDSVLEAYLASEKRFAAGTFFIQPCEPGPSAFTVSISSHGLRSGFTSER